MKTNNSLVPRYLCLSFAIILTAIISVSAHVLILLNFNAPPINMSLGTSQVIAYGTRICMVTAALLLYVLSCDSWRQLNLIKQTIAITIILLALTENLFRDFIMNVIVADSWKYHIVEKIPIYLAFLTIFFVICVLARTGPKMKNKILGYVLAILLATIMYMIVNNVGKMLLAPLMAHLLKVNINNESISYGLRILVPAYITYLEPVIAAFIVFKLTRNKLSTSSTAIKGLIFGGIIVLLHAGLYSVAQIICSEENIFYRIFYYGQFIWEYLLLGMLTAYLSQYYLIKSSHNI